MRGCEGGARGQGADVSCQSVRANVRGIEGMGVKTFFYDGYWNRFADRIGGRLLI